MRSLAKQITESVPEFFFIWNVQEQKILYLTDSFTDFTHEENPASDINAIKKVIDKTEHEKYDAIIDRLKEGDYNHDILLHSKTGAGQTMWLNLNTFPIKDDGNVTKVAFHIFDVTRRVHREENLKKEVERVEDILHIIVHDLRGPLGNIINMSRVQKRLLNMDEDPTPYSMADIIEREARDSIRLLQNMIEMVDLQDGKLVLDVMECDLIKVLNDVIGPYKLNIDAKNIKLKIIVPENPVKAYLDIVKFRLVLQNLLSNAIKFTDADGKIEIVLRDERNLAMLSFIDTGVGISEKRQQNLFQKFTSHTRGTDGEVTTGLGLSIAKKIIELHQGKIEVRSDVGQGSDFTIVLPKNPDERVPQNTSMS